MQSVCSQTCDRAARYTAYIDAGAFVSSTYSHSTARPGVRAGASLDNTRIKIYTSIAIARVYLVLQLVPPQLHFLLSYVPE